MLYWVFQQTFLSDTNIIKPVFIGFLWVSGLWLFVEFIDLVVQGAREEIGVALPVSGSGYHCLVRQTPVLCDQHWPCVVLGI